MDDGLTIIDDIPGDSPLLDPVEPEPDDSNPLAALTRMVERGSFKSLWGGPKVKPEPQMPRPNVPKAQRPRRPQRPPMTPESAVAFAQATGAAPRPRKRKSGR